MYACDHRNHEGRIQQLRLPRVHEYSIDLAIDGRQEASIPLFVKPAQ